MKHGALSFKDRLEFGLIAASLGAVVGALASLLLLGLFALIGSPRSFNVWMMVFSAGFFFAAGVVRGAESAETIADSFSAVLLAALGAMGIAGGGGVTTGHGRLEWRASLWWSVVYFSGMVLLAWLA